MAEKWELNRLQNVCNQRARLDKLHEDDDDDDGGSGGGAGAEDQERDREATNSK